MKKVFLLILLLCLCSSVFAVGLGASVDLGFIQDLLLSHKSLQAGVGLRLYTDGDFQLRLPLNLSLKGKKVGIEGALCAVYYPFTKGFYVSLSMIDLGFIADMSRKSSSMLILNEIEAGWTFEINEKFFAEAGICMRDPSGTFSSEYEKIRGVFDSYTRFRVRIAGGYRFF